MSEYIVEIGFWLRAYDKLSVEADTDELAIVTAKEAAKAAMASRAVPGHIDTDERREGLIVFIDRLTSNGREEIAVDITFDDDRIHPNTPAHGDAI